MESGISATKNIREQEKALALPRTPIIAMTANIDSDDIDSYIQAGMDDYMAKPYNKEDILRKILKTIDTQRLV